MRSLHPAAPSKLLLACLLLMSLSARSLAQTATCASKFNNCSTCNAGLTQCQSCMSGFYLDNTGKCAACGLDCLSCTSTICTACKPEFYNDFVNCYACPKGCSSCDTKFVCTDCKEGHYKQSLQCPTCSTGCKTCKDFNTCYQCNGNDYQLVSNKCQLRETNPVGPPLQGGAIAGITLGAIACFVIIIIIIICICRKQLRDRELAALAAKRQADEREMKAAGDVTSSPFGLANGMESAKYGKAGPVAISYNGPMQAGFQPSPINPYGVPMAQPTYTPPGGQPIYLAQAPLGFESTSQAPLIGIPPQAQPVAMLPPGFTKTPGMA